MLTNSTEIARSPEEVFGYLSQLDRHGEWQAQIVEVKDISDGPVGVGTRATDRRKLPGGPRDMTTRSPPTTLHGACRSMASTDPFGLPAR